MRLQGVELEFWRAFSAASDLPTALRAGDALLRADMPTISQQIWALDAAHRQLALAASTAPHPPNRSAVASAPDLLTEGAWRRIAPTEPIAREAGWAEEVTAVALGHDGAPIGLWVVAGAAAHVDTLLRLRDAVAAGLVHARRIEELAVLRDATEADNRALLSRLSRHAIVETVVGESGGLRELMHKVAQVAPTDAPVLLLGETGSGKEVVARALHERSRRASGPMVRVNCGAIAPELIDSELFGHERGSFTGAVTDRRGWFERAHGGTLLLDEVGELPLPAQVRLLRVLQDGTLHRVGAEQPTHVDVRIVAATHRDLPRMVEEGRFREDVWYRLSVFPLRLPPLRERPEDIPSLAAHFAARIGERLSGTPLVPSADDLRRLAAYPWPGNVRELAAVIERAAILGHGRRLDVAAARGASASAPPAERAGPVAVAETERLDDMVRQHIAEVLRRTRGRIEGPGGAAERLGVNPHTLRSRMRKLGIDWSRYRE